MASQPCPFPGLAFCGVQNTCSCFRSVFVCMWVCEIVWERWRLADTVESAVSQTDKSRAILRKWCSISPDLTASTSFKHLNISKHTIRKTTQENKQSDVWYWYIWAVYFYKRTCSWNTFCLYRIFPITELYIYGKSQYVVLFDLRCSQNINQLDNT